MISYLDGHGEQKMVRIASGFLVAVLALISSACGAVESALITSIKGEVVFEDSAGNKAQLPGLVKLNHGDILHLGDHARLQLVYFHSARQETWSGPGSVEVDGAQGKVVSGAPLLQLQQLAPQFARQISRTPAPDSKGKFAALRTRSVAPLESITQVQRTYQDMRAKVIATDRTPEIYLLSAFFELKEYDRIQEIFRQLDNSDPGDLEIKMLKTLYGKAINNAKMAAKK